MGTLWIVLQRGVSGDRAHVRVDGVPVLDLEPDRARRGSDVSRSFDVPSGEHAIVVELPDQGWRGNARFAMADKTTVIVRAGDRPWIEVIEGRLLHGN